MGVGGRAGWQGGRVAQAPSSLPKVPLSLARQPEAKPSPASLSAAFVPFWRQPISSPLPRLHAGRTRANLEKGRDYQC